METFSALLSLCAGNPPVTGGFPHKGTVTRILDVSFLLFWTNCWTITRLTGNSRRNYGHVMSPWCDGLLQRYNMNDGPVNHSKFSWKYKNNKYMWQLILHSIHNIKSFCIDKQILGMIFPYTYISLRWRHNECDGVSNHQPHDCLLKAQIKENIKPPRHWPLWGEFTGDRRIPRTKGQ